MNYPNNGNYYNGYGQIPQPNNTRQNTITADLINGGGLQAANAYYVAPGVTVILLDFPAGVFYIKSCDERGMPQQMRVCDFKERVQQINYGQDNGNQSSALQSQIDELKAMILSMNQQNQNGAISNNNQPRNQKKGGNQQ